MTNDLTAARERLEAYAKYISVDGHGIEHKVTRAADIRHILDALKAAEKARDYSEDMLNNLQEDYDKLTREVEAAAKFYIGESFRHTEKDPRTPSERLHDYFAPAGAVTGEPMKGRGGMADYFTHPVQPASPPATPSETAIPSGNAEVVRRFEEWLALTSDYDEYYPVRRTEIAQLRAALLADRLPLAPATVTPPSVVTDEDVERAREVYGQHWKGFGDDRTVALRCVLEDFASRQGAEK